jgi:two-component system sensor histidine kinase KdpD
MARGLLRVYLGAAPGVGKTVAMLDEAHRRVGRGTDVVVGLCETHGRKHTADLLEGLERVPLKEVEYRGSTFKEMDVHAILARWPAVALVDELAHTNVPGAGNEKRWQDIQVLLDAGIDVISTVNIQHLESLNDVVQKITGVPQRERVPDGVVRAADQVELVDMAPEALRRRMAHGNIYAADKVNAALGNYFRVGNLTALRELALLWTADKVDEALQQYREQNDIEVTWEARERVVVALTGGPEGETLIRRAARVAARSAGGDLLAVHVTVSDGLIGSSPATLAVQRKLVETLGGTYHQIIGDNIPKALLEFAHAENATQLVLGGSRRSKLTALTGPGIGAEVIRDSGEIDVHLVTHAQMGKGGGLPHPHGSLTLRRRLQGYGLGMLLPPLLTLLLASQRQHLNLVSDVLAFLLLVVVVALVGGFLPAMVAVVGGSLLLNYYFTPPLHTFTISEKNNVLALSVFIVVAALVSSVVDLGARRTRQAARATAEAEILGTMAGSVLRGETALPELLERVREAFALASVTLLERTPDSPPGRGAASRGPADEWKVVASAGDDPCERPEDADTQVPAAETLMLGLRGHSLRAEDQRVVGAFAAQAAVILERHRLSEAAAAALPIAEGDRMRVALLAAVGHDLRSPLASAKAAVTSLRSNDIQWSPKDHADLLLTADESLDRLDRLVGNLLDMSRLQAGALSVVLRPVALDEVVPLALDDLGIAGRHIVIEVPDDLPLVLADPGLLERVIANLVGNAVRYSPPGSGPVLTGSSLGERVELRVIDRGPGIPAPYLDRVFAPFQRLGDTDNTTGVGLGLALSRGLTEAMGGALTPEESPGGGLTMVVSLPAAPALVDPWTPAQPGLRERARQERSSATGQDNL